MARLAKTISGQGHTSFGAATPPLDTPAPAASSPPPIPAAKPAPLESHSPAALPANECRVVSLSSEEQCAPYLTQWEALANNLAEPNAFYEPWMLVPAIRQFAPRQLEIALILQNHKTQGERAIGLLPLERIHHFRGSPVSALRFWRHPHCYLCTPLIAKDAQRECWEAFFAWARARPGREMILEAESVSASGRVFDGLLDHLRENQRGILLERPHTRAILRLGRDYDSYLRSAVRSSHRRLYHHKRQLLEATGRLQSSFIEPGADAGHWVEQFLDLETRGWKGKTRTAMACTPADGEYFRTIALEAHRRSRLLMARLDFNGEPIAMHLGIYAGDGAFFLKTTYNETYARSSPGMLLALEMTRYLHEQGRIQWMDSCTAPLCGDTMKRLWHERRPIAGLLCSTGRPTGELLLSLVPLARRARQAFRRSS
jgi:CelD/BcsL family acetyltransferase involved in cellulose biosynthesis